MANIDVVIPKDLAVKVKVTGVKGGSCTSLTKDVETALGKTVKDEKTREFYEQPTTVNRNISR